MTLHYIALHCSYNYDYNYNYNYNYNYTALHYTTRHDTTLITPYHNCNYTTLCTLHSTTLQYNYNCNFNYNYNYSNNRATPHYIQQLWVR